MNENRSSSSIKSGEALVTLGFVIVIISLFMPLVGSKTGGTPGVSSYTFMSALPQVSRIPVTWRLIYIAPLAALAATSGILFARIEKDRSTILHWLAIFAAALGLVFWIVLLFQTQSRWAGDTVRVGGWFALAGFVLIVLGVASNLNNLLNGTDGKTQDTISEIGSYTDSESSKQNISPFLWILPVLFSAVGGIIAFFMARKKNKVQAMLLFVAGLIMQLVWTLLPAGK